MKKHSFVEKLTRFLNGKGFYAALALCVAVIGVSGYYLWQDLATASQMAAEVGRSATVEVDPAALPVPTPLTPQIEDSSSSEEEPDESEESPSGDGSASFAAAEEGLETAAEAETEAAETLSPQPDTVAAEEVHGWLWPLEGGVVAAFSADTLTYNSALGDWRTHNGIDLSAQLGQQVTAACAGTVVSIYDDALLGKTVSVDCGNGITTLYSNLAEKVSVTSGDRLAAGDVIGCVGDTAAGEVSQTPWLHFAVYHNGAAVDPTGYLR